MPAIPTAPETLTREVRPDFLRALDLLYARAEVQPGDHPLLRAHGLLALLTGPSPARTRQLVMGTILQDELVKLTGVLRGASVPFLPIKGPVLAHLLYDEPGLRPSSDLDVVVPPREHARCMQVLQAAGYRHRPIPYTAGSVEVFTTPTFGSAIEVHFQLATAERFGGLFAALWEGAVEVELRGAAVPAPAMEPHLVYLLVHLARHLEFPRAMWIEDFRRILARFGDSLDWDRVLRLSREHRLANALSLSMGLADSCFARCGRPERFPARVTRAIEADRTLHGRLLYRMVLPRLTSGRGTPGLRRLHSFGLSEGWRDRAELLGAFVRRRLPNP